MNLKKCDESRIAIETCITWDQMTITRTRMGKRRCMKLSDAYPIVVVIVWASSRIEVMMDSQVQQLCVSKLRAKEMSPRSHGVVSVRASSVQDFRACHRDAGRNFLCLLGPRPVHQRLRNVEKLAIWNPINGNVAQC